MSSVFWLILGAYVTKRVKNKVEKKLVAQEKRETETDTEHLIRVYKELKLLKDSRKIEVQFQNYKDSLVMKEKIGELEKEIMN